MNRVADLVDRLLPGCKVTDRGIEGLLLREPLQASARGFRQVAIEPPGEVPDRIEGLERAVGGDRPPLPEPLMGIPAHFRGDIERPLVRPLEIMLQGMADRLPVLLGAQRRAGAILIDHVADHRVRLGDMPGITPAETEIEVPDRLPRPVQANRRKLADQMPAIVPVIVEGGRRLLNVGNEALDL